MNWLEILVSISVIVGAMVSVATYIDNRKKNNDKVEEIPLEDIDKICK